MSRATQIGTIWKLRAVYALLGVMLFYGVEQLFLNKYLHSSAARGYSTVAFIIALVVFDVPTGVLADRIGRKACLVAACLAQMTGLIVMGVSNRLWVYLAGSVLFGLYLCLFNGAAQAYLYDWLASQDRTKQYAKLQGTMYAWWMVGAGVANLCSGFVAHYWGLRSVYFLSIIPGLIALAVLRKLHEPPREQKAGAAWYSHVNDALQEIRANKHIISFALQFMAATVVLLTIGEFGQIYILSFGVSTIMLGIYWAIDAGFAAGGRAFAHGLQQHPRIAMVLFCVVLAVFASVHSAYGIGLFWLAYGLNEALANIAETEVQDATSTHIRATMLSMVSFASNAVAIPAVLIFTAYYRHHGIIAANRLTTIAVVAVLAVTMLTRPTTKHLSAEATR